VTTLAQVSPVALTGAGAVSTAGVGMGPLAALVAGTGSPYPEPVAGDTPYPPVGLRTVPAFDLAAEVGRKGTRRLDRMTGFGIVAGREALTAAGRTATGDDRRAIGVAVATNTGSVRSFVDLTAEMTAPDQPPVITPSLFPNIVLNCCAGQIAIWHRLHGPNATLAAGGLSGLSALRYGATMVRRGRADGMLVGGVEELCPPVAWGWHALGAVPAGGSLGEGGAFVMAERPAPDRPVLAELLATELAYHGAVEPRESVADGLARLIRRALVRSGVTEDEVDVVSAAGSALSGAGRAERRAVRRALGRTPVTTAVTELVGDCFSATGAFQVTGLLARWTDGGHPHERVALLTGVARDGNIGCAVLRRPA
jgi:3-oxoacyl-[acyl-carrier-protein] synthase II